MSDFDMQDDVDFDDLDLGEIKMPPDGQASGTLESIKRLTLKDGRSPFVAEICVEWLDDHGETLKHVETLWFDLENGKTAADTLRDRKAFCEMLGGELVTVDGAQRMTGIGRLSDHKGDRLEFEVKKSKKGDRVFLNNIKPLT